MSWCRFCFRFPLDLEPVTNFDETFLHSLREPTLLFSLLLLASLKSQIHTIFIRKWQKRFPPWLACRAASTWAWLRPVHLSGAGNVASGFRCGHELSSLEKRCGGSRHQHIHPPCKVTLP